MNATDLYKLYGRVVLMGGNECRSWTSRDVSRVAQFCKARGINSMTMKVADGTIVWFTPEEVSALRKVALDWGVGFVPFQYCYGPRFGSAQIQAEARMLKDYMAANDNAGAIADMEAEWNGHAAAAEEFAAALKDKPGPLVVSTWADPGQQNWGGVLEALEPVADLIGPQQYTNYLGTTEGQFPAWARERLAPEINLSQAFGPNNQDALARQALKRGHLSLWLWYEGYAVGNQGLVHDLVTIMGGEPPTAPEGSREYTVQPGDSLWQIAARPDIYGNGLDWRKIYEANKGEIGADPDLIQPGMVLVIPPA